MLTLLASIGMFVIATGIIMGGSFLIRWLHSDDDFLLPWIVTSMLLGAVIACQVVHSIPIA